MIEIQESLLSKQIELDKSRSVSRFIPDYEVTIDGYDEKPYIQFIYLVKYIFKKCNEVKTESNDKKKIVKYLSTLELIEIAKTQIKSEQIQALKNTRVNEEIEGYEKVLFNTTEKGMCKWAANALNLLKELEEDFNYLEYKIIKEDYCNIKNKQASEVRLKHTYNRDQIDKIFEYLVNNGYLSNKYKDDFLFITGFKDDHDNFEKIVFNSNHSITASVIALIFGSKWSIFEGCFCWTDTNKSIKNINSKSSRQAYQSAILDEEIETEIKNLTK